MCNAQFYFRFCLPKYTIYIPIYSFLWASLRTKKNNNNIETNANALILGMKEKKICSFLIFFRLCTFAFIASSNAIYIMTFSCVLHSLLFHSKLVVFSGITFGKWQNKNIRFGWYIKCARCMFRMRTMRIW